MANDTRRFPPPWSVEDIGGLCSVKTPTGKRAVPRYQLPPPGSPPG
jgi:hypothetical protein